MNTIHYMFVILALLCACAAWGWNRALLQRDELKSRLYRVNGEVRDLQVQISRQSAPLHRPVIEGLDAEEFRIAFDVDDDQPLWQAVHQLLDAAIVKGVDDLTPAPSAAFTAEVRTHSAGELNALRDFQKDLLRWQREARRAKSAVAAGDGDGE